MPSRMARTLRKIPHAAYRRSDCGGSHSSAPSGRTRSDPTDERREQLMPAEWVDFKSIKGKVSMETILSHYDVRLRRVGANEFRGKCPLPTHSSTSSNDSFSVSFTRNAWSCQSASCIAARSGRVGGNVFDFVAEMERCSIREAALHLQHSLAENQTPHATSRNEESVALTPENRPLSFTLRNIDHQHPYVASRGLSEQTARYFGVVKRSPNIASLPASANLTCCSISIEPSKKATALSFSSKASLTLSNSMRPGIITWLLSWVQSCPTARPT
ncbi:MAG: hypothetical protein DMG34_05145 [Acidobacteria bacterium]|nr:MAG: hypothetical protein DMG34_05145 [Acidobacteriota bacterium]